MNKLDLKDRKILYELDTDSRQTYNEIAKKVGLGKDSIIYRIEAMQKTGIIKQFHTVINVGKLGFTSFRLYLKLQNATPEKEAEIIEFLKNQKLVTWLVSIEGEFDIGMWVLTKTIKEMNKFYKELLERYVNYIDKRWLTIFTKVSYFTRAYILEKEVNDREFVFITEPEEIELDKIDYDILNAIAPNSRITTMEIAKKAGITPKTAASRIKELEKKKIIVGYRTMLDLEKLGYQYFKVHFNLHDVTIEKEKAIRTYIKQHPNIIYDNEVLGGDDIEIEIQVKDLNELRTIINDMKYRFADIIKDYRYFLFYKEHKFVFMPG
ncbi:MAG: Lrp/AsnC family transcriptional regulator [Candidatus Micrarchaeota archaeon]|nr:Lrp/AsnC family transcriptional regulator [Candidatus Micrarchaeota archaeon]